MQRKSDIARPVILWFRRDLRLNDNPALQAAVETKQPVICLYVREDGAAFAGARRRQFCKKPG